jgi:hypothetical protein
MVSCQVCGKTNQDDAIYCFSCGTRLLRAPPVKVEVKSPVTGLPVTPAAPPLAAVPSTYTPRQVARPGSCYYHPELPSMAICSRCGRSICAGCIKPYGVLNFCPECFHGLAGRIGYDQSTYQYPYTYQYPVEQQPQERRSLF